MSATARPKFCPECGVRLGEEDRFCGGCGGAVTEIDAGVASAITPPTATHVDDAAPRRGLRHMPLAVALAALCALGVGAFAFTHRTVAGGRPNPPERAAKTTPAPEIHSYLYTLHLDLSSLSKPTQVRIRFKDLDGLRSVDSRSRDPGAKFNVAVRGKGETVTWRIYYDGTLVKTVAAKSDGTQVDGGAL